MVALLIPNPNRQCHHPVIHGRTNIAGRFPIAVRGWLRGKSAIARKTMACFLESGQRILSAHQHLRDFRIWVYGMGGLASRDGGQTWGLETVCHLGPVPPHHRHTLGNQHAAHQREDHCPRAFKITCRRAYGGGICAQMDQVQYRPDDNPSGCRHSRTFAGSETQECISKTDGNLSFDRMANGERMAADS